MHEKYCCLLCLNVLVFVIALGSSRANGYSIRIFGDYVTIVKSSEDRIIPIDVYLDIQDGPVSAHRFQFDAFADGSLNARILGGGNPIRHPDPFPNSTPIITTRTAGWGFTATGQHSSNRDVELNDGDGLFSLNVRIPADSTGLFYFGQRDAWLRNAAGSNRILSLTGSPRIVVTEIPPPPPIHTPPPLLFWSDSTAGRLHRSFANGEFPQTLASNMHNADELAIDARRGHIYWTVGDRRTPEIIMRSKLDGSEAQVVLAKSTESGADQFPSGLAIDSKNEKLYYTESNSRALYRVNLDGSNEEILYRDVENWVQHVALDLVNGHVYTTHNLIDGGGEIQRANLDGSDRTTVVQGQTPFDDIVVDSVNGNLYWGDSHSITGAIWRSRLDGTNREIVVQYEGFKPSGMDVDVVAGKLYWGYWDADYFQGIQRSDLDGTNIETVHVAERTSGHTRVGDVAVIPIPEPTGNALLVTGAVGYLFCNVRCRSRKSGE